jgi:metal-responsive CopG/Arc/MetJ family transcriptional regulator
MVVLVTSMKTAISIPDPVFDSAEALAKKLKISRSQLYTKAVEEFVTTHTATSVRETLDRVYGSEPSSVDPSVAKAQSATITHEDW